MPPDISTHPAHEAKPARLRLASALSRLPSPTGERFVEVFSHGAVSVDLYAPQDKDPQKPHTRDEIYFVAKGRGTFWNGTERHPFAPGDLLFVPAGVPHRFEDFSDDVALWVVFYGPEGGETGPALVLS